MRPVHCCLLAQKRVRVSRVSTQTQQGRFSLQNLVITNQENKVGLGVRTRKQERSCPQRSISNSKAFVQYTLLPESYKLKVFPYKIRLTAGSAPGRRGVPPRESLPEKAFAGERGAVALGFLSLAAGNDIYYTACSFLVISKNSCSKLHCHKVSI